MKKAMVAMALLVLASVASAADDQEKLTRELVDCAALYCAFATYLPEAFAAADPEAEIEPADIEAAQVEIRRRAAMLEAMAGILGTTNEDTRAYGFRRYADWLAALRKDSKAGREAGGRCDAFLQ
jgi:hypothetical protein